VSMQVDHGCLPLNSLLVPRCWLLVKEFSFERELGTYNEYRVTRNEQRVTSNQ
jgi:hypothetical protein